MIGGNCAAFSPSLADGAPASSASSPLPPSRAAADRSAAANRLCISTSKAVVFWRAAVRTETSREPRDWSRISSRCFCEIEQKSTVRAWETRQLGGKSDANDESYVRSSWRCHA